MLRYSLLFIHVISAMAMFTSLGMEAVALGQLHRGTGTSAVRAALASFGSSQRLGGVGALLLALSGIVLAMAYWRWQGAWMGLGLVGLVAIGAVRGLMTGPAVRRAWTSVADGGSAASVLEALPRLRRSFAIRATLLAGIVFLMTVKPSPPVALGSLVTAAIIGLALGRGTARTEVSQAAGVSQ